MLIEEVQGLQNIDEICKAHPRLECAIFGMGDYSASQAMAVRSGGDNDYPGDIWYYPRFRLALAARASGIDPVDGPYGNYKNPDQYRKEAELGMIVGCVGKWAIHPVSDRHRARRVHAEARCGRGRSALVERIRQGRGGRPWRGEH